MTGKTGNRRKRTVVLAAWLLAVCILVSGCAARSGESAGDTFRGRKAPSASLFRRARKGAEKKPRLKRGFFMKTATQDAVRKWASACGAYIPQFATPEEFASVISGMTGCLQSEFFERAGNGERFDFA